jgi:exopolyphosphatase/guanosine-5'-triphosphate,3'-diphosphate pyrophosphatase
MARFAAIDVGSNAMRLRIVEAERNLLTAPAASLAWREVATLRAPVRLGREVFLTGTLTNQAISSATEALRQFRETMDEHKVDQYRAVATSAVREADNAEALVERAYREAGVHVEVIEGVEEARLVQLAVRRRLSSEQGSALLIDIGGGSTELTLLEQGEPRASQSLPLGTVRLLEAFLETDMPVDARHAELVDEYVERVLGEMLPELAQGRPELLVATGGTSDTLLQLCPGVSAGMISLDAVRKLTAELSALPVDERIRRYNLRADRADTIVPAAQILLHVARRSGHQQILVPGVGLKEGVLEDLIDKRFARWSALSEEDAITKTCIRLGRRFQFDEGHGLLVATLATRLFDDLKLLHRLGERYRLLLKAAALLHDIGDFIRYEGHHKHSFYIIEQSDLMGITPTERKVVANIARYHRKGFPEPSHPNFRELSREDRAAVRSLSSILRLADALDREHLGKVTDVQATMTRGRLRLDVRAAADHELELWTVEQKSSLFREVFALDVEVHDRPVDSSARPVDSVRRPATSA